MAFFFNVEVLEVPYSPPASQREGLVVLEGAWCFPDAWVLTCGEGHGGNLRRLRMAAHTG